MRVMLTNVHDQAVDQGRRSRVESQQQQGHVEQGTSSQTAQDKNLDYLCPICFELITEVDFHQSLPAFTFAFFSGSYDKVWTHILLCMPPPDN